jgi:hypothetical protein
MLLRVQKLYFTRKCAHCRNDAKYSFSRAHLGRNLLHLCFKILKQNVITQGKSITFDNWQWTWYAKLICYLLDTKMRWINTACYKLHKPETIAVFEQCLTKYTVLSWQFVLSITFTRFSELRHMPLDPMSNMMYMLLSLLLRWRSFLSTSETASIFIRVNFFQTRQLKTTSANEKNWQLTHERLQLIISEYAT